METKNTVLLVAATLLATPLAAVAQQYAATDLGGAGSSGLGINASGQVIGFANTAAGAQHAFFYSNGQMVDLNSKIGSADSLYTLISADAINDGGQIVANGIVNATDQDVAFLLTPTSPVPEPAAAWLLVSGLGVLGALVRRNSGTIRIGVTIGP